MADYVIYELHVGTFTPEGTFDAVIPRLAALRELGITAIELMPVAQFPGERNWGYDGVDLYAPQNSYGGPEALKRLVNAAHAEGLAVVLDVVYNHVGPEGNYLVRVRALLHGCLSHAVGSGVNYDGAGQRRGASLRHRERMLLGARLPHGRASTQCRPRHLRLSARVHLWRSSPRACTRWRSELDRHGAGDRGERSQRSATAAPRGAGRLLRWTRSGATTSITRSTSRSPGRAPDTTKDSRARRHRSRSQTRSSAASCSRGSTRRIAERQHGAPAHRRVRRALRHLDSESRSGGQSRCGRATRRARVRPMR